MRQTNWNARRKLFASLVVLAIVLVIAAIAQFTGKERRVNPYAASNPVPQAPVARTQPGGRAVFGGDPRSDPTDASPQPGSSNRETAESATRSRATNNTESVPGASGDIEHFLARWRDTVARGDLEGQANLYAPTVTRFFRQRNVSHAAVKKVKSQMMSLYPTVNRYEISDVKVESNNGNEAVVSLRKEWDMNGRQRFTGAERQRLRLRRMGNDWKIVSEEETKVYWVKRG
jgi:hypothetical protein